MEVTPFHFPRARPCFSCLLRGLRIEGAQHRALLLRTGMDVDDECCVSKCIVVTALCRHESRGENPIDVIPSPASLYLFLSAIRGGKYGAMQLYVCQSAHHSARGCSSSPVGGALHCGKRIQISFCILHKARYRQNAAIAFAEPHSKKFHVWNFPYGFHEHSGTCRSNLPSRRPSSTPILHS